MRRSKYFDMSLIAILAAILFVMSMVPMVGFIPIPFLGISVTIMHIPIIVGAIGGNKRKIGVSLGLVFGLLSMWIAFIRPSSPFDMLFQNPLISVLPRVLFGWVAFEIFNLMKKVYNNFAVNVAITAFLSTILHGVFVGAALIFFGRETTLATFGTESIVGFFQFLILSVSIFEALVAAVIATPIVVAINSRFKGVR